MIGLTDLIAIEAVAAMEKALQRAEMDKEDSEAMLAGYHWLTTYMEYQRLMLLEGLGLACPAKGPGPRQTHLSVLCPACPCRIHCNEAARLHQDNLRTLDEEGMDKPEATVYDIFLSEEGC